MNLKCDEWLSNPAYKNKYNHKGVTCKTVKLSTKYYCYQLQKAVNLYTFTNGLSPCQGHRPSTPGGCQEAQNHSNS